MESKKKKKKRTVDTQASLLYIHDTRESAIGCGTKATKGLLCQRMAHHVCAHHVCANVWHILSVHIMYVPKYGTCMCQINISQATRLLFLAWLSRAVLSFLNLAREKAILKSY